MQVCTDRDMVTHLRKNIHSHTAQENPRGHGAWHWRLCKVAYLLMQNPGESNEETMRDHFITVDEKGHAHDFMCLFLTCDCFQQYLSVHRIRMLPSKLTTVLCLF